MIVNLHETGLKLTSAFHSVINIIILFMRISYAFKINFHTFRENRRERSPHHPLSLMSYLQLNSKCLLFAKPNSSDRLNLIVISTDYTAYTYIHTYIYSQPYAVEKYVIELCQSKNMISLISHSNTFHAFHKKY